MNAKFDQHFFGAPFAANGYVTAIPDYLGLGTTSLAHHPFNHAKTEATAIVDMLRASKQFCREKGIELIEQIFLVGYSQGGHATMSVHRELEALHQDEFEVTASSPGGGAYQLSRIMRDSMLFSEDYSNPFFIAYAIISWQSVYEDIYSEIGEVFRPPYDSMVLRIFNRQNPQSHLIDSLPRPGVQILQPDFLDALLTDSLHPLNSALRDNDVYDWLPLAPVRLYYCEGDEIIPYENSLFTYNHMLALGADVNVFDGGPNFTHATCTYPAVIGAKLWFDEFRQDCAVATVEKDKKQVTFYPNPFQDEIRISDRLSDPGSVDALNVYERSGQTIYKIAVMPLQKSLQLDLIPGVYLFELVQGNRRTLQKVIKI
jgi:pimeloyl-ACP methyl ester carboxylesterase